MIFAAGTGNPFFTTDTAAALRALEVGCEAILMGKNGVDGVYDADPRERGLRAAAGVSHREALERDLRVMDATALSLCMENDLPIHVFNVNDAHNIGRIVAGSRIGTIVSSGAPRGGSLCRTSRTARDDDDDDTANGPGAGRDSQGDLLS